MLEEVNEQPSTDTSFTTVPFQTRNLYQYHPTTEAKLKIRPSFTISIKLCSIIGSVDTRG